MVKIKKPNNKKKDKKYPKQNLSSNNNHKIRRIKARKHFIKNPLPLYFKLTSHFIFSEIDFIEQFNKLQNKNVFKLTDKEENFLENQIKEINICTSIDNNEEFIELNKDIADKIINFKKYYFIYILKDIE